MIRASHLASFALLVTVVVTSACSSSTSSTGSPDGGSTSGGVSPTAQCGFALSGPKWLSNCQAWSDQYCCAKEKACADDASCAALIRCIEACPTPRKDACISACMPDGGNAVNLLDGFSACTKATPSGGDDIPPTCEWPTG